MTTVPPPKPPPPPPPPPKPNPPPPKALLLGAPGDDTLSAPELTPTSSSIPPPRPPKPTRNPKPAAAPSLPSLMEEGAYDEDRCTETQNESFHSSSCIPNKSNEPNPMVRDSSRVSRLIPSMTFFNNKRGNTMSIRVASSHRVSTKFGECEVIFHGMLAKRTREGTFEKYMFTITTETVSYYKLPSTAVVGVEEVDNIENHEKDLRSIPLNEIIVRPLRDCDYEGSEKRLRAFRFLSKHKSFLLRAKSPELKIEWYEALEKAAHDARSRAGLPELAESETAPLWIINENACQICKVSFSFFTRKHHCRHCGRCVCDDCSREKVRIPKFDDRTLFKVCSDCAKYFKEQRTYGV